MITSVKKTIDDILRIHHLNREQFYLKLNIDRRRACQLIYGGRCSQEEIEELLCAVNSLLSNKVYTLAQIQWIEDLPS